MVTPSGSGAGSNKCTEVANGKHNTKIDKLLQHELNDATKCKNCEQPQQNPSSTSGLGRSDGPSRDTARGPTANHVDSEVAEDENEEDDDEEENEEGEEDGHGEGAADTKKKGQTH
ncbi:hypothetical protein PFUGPA_02714 [Plasmodium falciparum Palo Alto/Uganda]|uniref:Uncharacterized protein n=2 Tax=Plasmodium falciparum TaxID=5833 RepID=W4J0Z3_PLAFP|nr:hypothetical protein PFUGPA_02714 [Plasmodium falciparum Palo Alto/Uganda]ETW58166.1 hypothetical protein PFMC_05936 [Plasmodium falciparum CAMP/Malaysia]